jgi:hypothetical protein
VHDTGGGLSALMRKQREPAIELSAFLRLVS